MEFTPVILAHIATATGALVLGGIALGMRKGTRLHRLLGYSWVTLMMSTAIISFGIRTAGHLSPIHLLSVLTLIAVPAAIFAAIRGKIAMHRRGMTAAYVSLVVAGALTLLPMRQLGRIVWSGVGLI